MAIPTRRRTSTSMSPSAGSATWYTKLAPFESHSPAMAAMASAALSPLELPPAAWISSRQAASVSSSMWKCCSTRRMLAWSMISIIDGSWPWRKISAMAVPAGARWSK